jgi:uncharacterized protein DUF4177
MNWEYLVEELESCMPAGVGITKSLSLHATISQHLNKRGAEGWELVETWKTGQAIAALLIFKRPKP